MYVAHTNFTPPGFAWRHRGKGDHPHVKAYSVHAKPGQDWLHIWKGKPKAEDASIELDTLARSSYAAFKDPRNQLIHTLISWSPAHGRDDENIFRQGDWKTGNTSKAFQLLKHPDVRLGEGDPGPKKMAMPKRLLDYKKNFEWLTEQLGDREVAWEFIKDVLTLFYQERDNLFLDKAKEVAEMRIKTHQEKLGSSKSGSQTSLSHNRKSRSTQTRQVSIAPPNRDEPSGWLFSWPRPKFFLTSRPKGSSMYELGDWTIKPK